ncbi:three-helix bundle dimerization domain-containing protein [Amycolatopsis sp. NPDC004169]|uniref:three-helix bundle dimerization domain-containing protein n=1 Tax=Amycolatopsis sp. NPDC004169 TaxID=3154453 RepID=UPI0033BB57B4
MFDAGHLGQRSSWTKPSSAAAVRRSPGECRLRRCRRRSCGSGSTAAPVRAGLGSPPPELIKPFAALVDRERARFAGARIHAFVPILVERAVRSALTT